MSTHKSLFRELADALMAQQQEEDETQQDTPEETYR